MDFHNLFLIVISYHTGSFEIRAKGINHVGRGSDYMADALKLPCQAPGVFGEPLQTCVALRCPDICECSV